MWEIGEWDPGQNPSWRSGVPRLPSSSVVHGKGCVIENIHSSLLMSDVSVSVSWKVARKTSAVPLARYAFWPSENSVIVPIHALLLSAQWYLDEFRKLRKRQHPGRREQRECTYVSFQTAAQPQQARQIAEF